MTSSAIKTEKFLKIGEIAANSGLPVKTIRYYEEIGLLTPTVARSESGYRLFSREVITRLTFIKRAQALGLQLTEIQEILSVHDQGQIPCDEVRQHLEGKVAEIEQKIRSLQILKSELQTVLSAWKQPTEAEVTRKICPDIS